MVNCSYLTSLYCFVKVSDILGKANRFYVLCCTGVGQHVGTLDKPTLFLSILGEMNNKGILCSLIHFPRASKRIGAVGSEGD